MVDQLLKVLGVLYLVVECCGCLLTESAGDPSPLVEYCAQRLSSLYLSCSRTDSAVLCAARASRWCTTTFCAACNNW